MPFIPTVSRACLLLRNFGGWFGGPVIKQGGKVIDGRKRLEAWTLLSKPGQPPTVVVRTAREAARLVLLAGHADRAHAMLGESIGYDENTAALLHVPAEVGAALVGYHKRARRKRRPAPRRRSEVVNRLRALYFETAERGHEPTLDDLREALGDWM